MTSQRPATNRLIYVYPTGWNREERRAACSRLLAAERRLNVTRHTHTTTVCSDVTNEAGEIISKDLKGLQVTYTKNATHATQVHLFKAWNP